MSLDPPHCWFEYAGRFQMEGKSKQTKEMDVTK